MVTKATVRTKSQRSKYSAEQLAHWKATHKDFKSGSTVRGDASVLKFVPGVGTTTCALEHWTP